MYENELIDLLCNFERVGVIVFYICLVLCWICYIWVVLFFFDIGIFFYGFV